jgi:hypothetical protein
MQRNIRFKVRNRTLPELRRVNIMRMELQNSLPVQWHSPEAIHRREFGYFQSDEQLEDSERVQNVFRKFDYGLTVKEFVIDYQDITDLLHAPSCEDEELQPIECEKHGSCKNCPHYKSVKVIGR